MFRLEGFYFIDFNTVEEFILTDYLNHIDSWWSFNKHIVYYNGFCSLMIAFTIDNLIILKRSWLTLMISRSHRFLVKFLIFIIHRKWWKRKDSYKWMISWIDEKRKMYFESVWEWRWEKWWINEMEFYVSQMDGSWSYRDRDCVCVCLCMFWRFSKFIVQWSEIIVLDVT